mgnify:CR=1 FL=1
MDKELLQTLSDMFDEKLKPIQDNMENININLSRIEKKLDNVVDQTADLTEFRTATLDKLEDITDNLNKVESITASNWKDITKLKSVK